MSEELSGKPRHDWAEAVMENIFDVVLVTTLKREIIDSNAAIEKSMGYTEAEIRGKSANILVENSEDLNGCYDDADDNTSKANLRRFLARRKNGETYWVDTGTKKISENHYLLVFHDVDERARARKSLEEQKLMIEQALTETERLRKEAEESKLKLEQANVQLAQRQAATEAALQNEVNFRLNAQRTDFQKSFAIVLVALVAFGLLLPYVGSLIGATEKVTDGTGSLSLLLIQTLAVVAGSLFQARRKDEEKS